MFHTRRHPEQRRASFHRAPQGAPPGTIVVDPAAPKPRIDVMAFDESDLKEVEVQSVEELRTLTERWPVTWVNVEGLGDADVIGDIGALYGLHPLALEDVVHVHQRAKVEPYEAHLFIVLRMVTLGATGLVVEQLGLFLGEGFVLTFQERPGGDAFDPVRDRLRRSRGQIRRRPPDYLAYALLDAVVDGYFIPLEAIGDRLEALEEQVLSGGASRAASIHALRRDLLILRRAAWPLRDAINDLLREGHPLISGETQLYLRDCYDHCIQIVELVESYRELTSGLMDMLLTTLNNRLSETMKVLTLIATLFMPLSFIAGMYGMNFDTSHPLNMPELGWAYGYPYALGLMGLVAGGMLGYFWRKGWLRERE